MSADQDVCSCSALPWLVGAQGLSVLLQVCCRRRCCAADVSGWLIAQYAAEIAEAAYQAGQLIEDGPLTQLLQHCSAALSNDISALAAAEASASSTRFAQRARAHDQMQHLPMACVNAVGGQLSTPLQRTRQLLRTQLTGRQKEGLKPT